MIFTQGDKNRMVNKISIYTASSLILLALLAIMTVLTPSRAYATTYSTFNPSDKSSNITLSGGNLTAAASGIGGVRSIISKTSGKWYWEYTVVTASQSFPAIYDETTDLTEFPGQSGGINGNAYYANNGQWYTAAGGVSCGSALTAGDVVGMALDADAGQVSIYLNNALQCTKTLSGLDGLYFPAFGALTGASVTANFGATALTYTPPAGYSSGVCDAGCGESGGGGGGGGGGATTTPNTVSGVDNAVIPLYFYAIFLGLICFFFLRLFRTLILRGH